MPGKTKRNEKQEKLIQEYKEYLLGLEYTEKTRNNYISNLSGYLISNRINTKKALIREVSSKRIPRSINKVYGWLGITAPTYKKRKKSMKHEGYNPYSDPLIREFQKERNIQSSTIHGYTSSMKLYIPFCGFNSAQEMIDEALEDERNHVPIKEARITQHLRAYRAYLNEYETIKTNHSKHTYFTKLETFYRHFQVTVPQRPPMTLKSEYHVSYYDIPNKDMIEQAIDQSEIMWKAIIYFMSSSGTAKAETLNLTVETFINGLRDYTDTTNPQRVVEELEGRKDLVPLLTMTRLKTNIPYFTCCSPEATYHILRYMKTHNHYDPTEKLFPLKGSRVMKYFQTLNDENNWGFVGPYRRFRTHMLRKFHASNLGCSFEVINTLEGRTNGTIHETYVKQKPDKIKQIYMEHMSNVMIHPERYVGPNCGNETEEVMIRNIVQESVRDMVPAHEEMIKPQQQPQVQMLQQAPFDYNILKDIARLETRMDAIEQRLEKLGG